MDDQVLVGVLHRRADLHEHLQSRGRVQVARLAVLVDRLPFDELHGEVGQAVGRGAAVEQSADVGMVEAGENLALVAEAADDRVGVHAALEDFERHALLERVVAADGKVDGAHAAASQLFDETVGADPHAVDAAVQAASGGSVVLFGWAHGSEYKQPGIPGPFTAASPPGQRRGRIPCRGQTPLWHPGSDPALAPGSDPALAPRVRPRSDPGV